MNQYLENITKMGKYRKNKSKNQLKTGRGLNSSLLTRLIPIRPTTIIGHSIKKAMNDLSVEAHLPGGYQYCGPGTHLKERIKRGDPGINTLDKACKKHDIAYDYSPSDMFRKSADIDLLKEAFAVLSSKNVSFGERCAALAVVSAMTVNLL